MVYQADPDKKHLGAFAGPGKKTKVVVQPDRSALDEANRHNDAEWKLVTDAAEAHRALVRKGVDTAIELINGHGSNIDNGKGGTCGVVGAQTWGTDISRGPFHAANYAAVKNNACTWIVADFSCTGGLTPRAIDELSNTGNAACLGRSTANSCDLHAAFKGNVSVSSATAEGLCTSSDKKAMRAQFADMVKSSRTGRMSGSGGFWYAFRGYYSDAGKIDCGPHVRRGY